MPSIANQRRPGPFALSVLLAVLLATLLLLVSLPAHAELDGAELDRDGLADFVTRGMARPSTSTPCSPTPPPPRPW
jgi:hypothetical protein